MIETKLFSKSEQLKNFQIQRTMKKIIEDFKAKTGYTLEVKDGNLYCSGSLYLKGCTGITSLPDGLTVGGYLDLEGCTGVTSLPDGLTVGGSLDLEGCTGVTSLPDGLTVGGSLYLRGTGITSLPDGLTVGGSLDLHGTGITSLPDGLTVGGSLYLRGTGITSLPDGLTVGGSLYLRGTGITSLPDGLTVGGYLDLRGTGVTDTSKVNRELSQSARAKIRHLGNMTLLWEWAGRSYIKADGMFAEVLSRRGNVYKLRQVDGKQLYLVTDVDGHFAHGDTLREAKEDLIYKINDRDTSQYEGLTQDSELPFEEAIAAYRTITGACSAGTRDYIVNRLPKPHKESYTVGEIIELTKGEYGSETFRKFFDK